MRQQPASSRHLIVFIALGLLSACAATKVSTITKDSAFNAKDLHRVLVIAVVRKPATQKLLENEFVRVLMKRGSEGVASYTLVPEGAKLDEDAWKRIVNDNHFDSVIVSRLVDFEVVEKDVDPKVLNGTSSSASGYGYYNMSYASMYQPGFTLRKETAAIETRVFEAEGAKQMWSAHSKTNIEQGRDPEAQVHDFVRLMMDKIYD